MTYIHVMYDIHDMTRECCTSCVSCVMCECEKNVQMNMCDDWAGSSASLLEHASAAVNLHGSNWWAKRDDAMCCAAPGVKSGGAK